MNFQRIKSIKLLTLTFVVDGTDQMEDVKPKRKVRRKNLNLVSLPSRLNLQNHQSLQNHLNHQKVATN